MPVISIFTCNQCGFKAEDLALGSGLCAFQTAVICKDCKTIMSRPVDNNNNVLEKFKRCHICQSNNLILWDGVCPHCGSKDFREEFSGTWW